MSPTPAWPEPVGACDPAAAVNLGAIPFLQLASKVSVSY